MAGNAVIGALRVNLGIDTAQFTEGLGKAQSNLAAFGKKVAVAAAAVGVAIAGALAVGVKHALDSADDMSKIAAKIGIPIEELSKLKYVADLSGVSLQALQTSVGKLSKNMSDAADGTGDGKKAFDRLGISVSGADRKLKSASQVMAEVSDKFAAMPNGAQKTALAMQLMGRAGADMIPLLNGGSAALNEMMAEAKSLGLEISQKTGTAAEQFNDNLSRMGYAVTGLTLGLTAALAPALAVISDAMVEFVKWTLQALQYLPAIAEHVAVAGGALAIMFSPAILVAVGNLAIAIGTGLVGALNLLKAAILANPLGAIAVGIALAITAIYHFRDEIKSAIGVDVVAIVKGAGNIIIGTFVGAFNATKDTWSMLPAVIGDVAIQAANRVMQTMQTMLRNAVNNINGAMQAIAGMVKGSPFEFNAPQIDRQGVVGKFGSWQMNNPYAGAAADAAGTIKSAFSQAYGTDYIGGLTSSVGEMNTALSTTGEILDDLGGGGGGSKGKKSGGKVAKLKQGFDRVGQAIQSAQETLGEGFSSVLEGLIDKSLSWTDALKKAGQALLKYLNQMNLAQGGSGLFGGGLFQGLLGGLLGFASGGTILPGGTGGIDSQLVAFRKSPNEQVDITKPGQRGGGGVAEVRVYMDRDGNWQAAVERISQRSAVGVVHAAAPGIVQGSVSATQAASRNRPGFFRR